jgi:DNA polymerase
VLAWLAGQDDVTKQFAKGEDVYSIFASKIYKQTITKANPVERFVGKTCILGLGYGTGAKKLQHTLKTQPPGADLADDECKRIVDLYRAENDKITDLWKECDNALEDMMSWSHKKKSYSIGEHGVLFISEHGICLPNGLYIRYRNLRNEDNKVTYDSRKGPVSIWGGAMVENVVQALARIIVGEQMLAIKERYRPVLTVHDAAVIVVPKNELNEGLEFITQVMSTPPTWAEGLPVACEAKYGESYGEC